MEITSRNPVRNEEFKNALIAVDHLKDGATTTIKYVDTPRNKREVTAENFKLAEILMNCLFEKTRSSIKRELRVFIFLGLESKKSHQTVKKKT